jgi:hypothetical protein
MNVMLITIMMAGQPMPEPPQAYLTSKETCQAFIADKERMERLERKLYEVHGKGMSAMVTCAEVHTNPR